MSASDPSPNSQDAPKGELALRTLAMPADANPNGDIFGGWVMAQMDIAGGISAWNRADGRVATVAVDGFTFHRPIYVGDVVCCYTDIVHVGKTSVQVLVSAWVLRGRRPENRIKVTEGTFSFVAIDADGKKRDVPSLDNL